MKQKENNMRLSDKDIEKWLDKKKIIIKPRPTIVNGVTIDLKLDNEFRFFNSHHYSVLDLGDKKISSMLKKISHKIKVKKEDSFFLYPNELVLAKTCEYIKLPDNIVGWLDGRSSLARLGLMIHVTAHRIDPGWSGCIVLECYNSGKITLGLRPGMIIGALSFELLSSGCIRPYNLIKSSKYKDQKKII